MPSSDGIARNKSGRGRVAVPRKESSENKRNREQRAGEVIGKRQGGYGSAPGRRRAGASRRLRMIAPSAANVAGSLDHLTLYPTSSRSRIHLPLQHSSNAAQQYSGHFATQEVHEVLFTKSMHWKGHDYYLP